jgi:hypothetical protein
VDRQGRRRDYSSAYLRRTYRDGGKVRNETVANLSALPHHVIDLVDAGLKGHQLVPAGEAVTIARSLPHGHVAAAHAMAARLGLPALLGPAGRARDLALALVISRVVAPASKLSTLTWWDDTTLGGDLGVSGASTDDVYAAMDWPVGRTRSRRNWPPATSPRSRAPLTYTDENPPAQDNPVTTAQRCRQAQAKASCQHDAADRPYRSFRGLLQHLATLTRNQVRFAGTRVTVPMLAEPTSAQRDAFDLIGAPIPLRLK